MSKGKLLFQSGIGGKTIVAGKKDQCVLLHLIFPEGIHYLPQHIIDHQNEIAVITGFAFSQKLSSRKYWGMWCRQREIQEKRLLTLRPGMDIINCLLRESREHLHGFKVITTRSPSE